MNTTTETPESLRAKADKLQSQAHWPSMAQYHAKAAELRARADKLARKECPDCKGENDECAICGGAPAPSREQPTDALIGRDPDEFREDATPDEEPVGFVDHTCQQCGRRFLRPADFRKLADKAFEQQEQLSALRQRCEAAEMVAEQIQTACDAASHQRDQLADRCARLEAALTVALAVLENAGCHAQDPGDEQGSAADWNIWYRDQAAFEARRDAAISAAREALAQPSQPDAE